MRLFILSLIFVLLSSTLSIAVHSPIVVGEQSTDIENNGDHQINFTKKLTNWLKKSYSNVKEFLKEKFSDEEKDLLMLILIFCVPPLAMYMYEGEEWTNRVTTNLILSILCLIPGIIHAAVLIFGKK